MANFLNEMLAYKAKFVTTLAPFDEKALTANTCNFLSALFKVPPVAVIGEIKAKSPVKGVMRAPSEVEQIAREYTEGGAAALSVLTDEAFFNGSFDTLAKVHTLTPLPLLCKDFVIDTRQVAAARRAGASAVLLIVRILDDEKLRALKDAIERLNMLALIEIHDATDLERALKIDPKVLLINNRDLETLTMHRGNDLLLAKHVPTNIPLISASGFDTPEEIRALDARFCAALVGTALMLSNDHIHFLQQTKRVAAS